MLFGRPLNLWTGLLSAVSSTGLVLIVTLRPDVDAAQAGNLVHHEAEHVIERAVLQHQHDDVLDARMGAVLVRPRRVWLSEDAAHRRRGCPPRDC